MAAINPYFTKEFERYFETKFFLDLMSLNKNQSCSKSGKIRSKRAL